MYFRDELMQQQHKANKEISREYDLYQKYIIYDYIAQS